LDDFELFKAAKKVVETIFEYATPDPASPDNLWLEDRREREPNHSMYQTLSGLFLELFSNGGPHSLWTPWGVWEFTFSSTGDWESAMKNNILPRLGATFHRELRASDKWGDFGAAGAVYAVHCLDSLGLPDPVERPQEQWHHFAEKAQTAWQTMNIRLSESGNTA